MGEQMGAFYIQVLAKHAWGNVGQWRTDGRAILYVRMTGSRETRVVHRRYGHRVAVFPTEHVENHVLRRFVPLALVAKDT